MHTVAAAQGVEERAKGRKKAQLAARGEPGTSSFPAETVPACVPMQGRVSFAVELRLVAYMIPSVVPLVPLLVIFRSYGLINTCQGLILAEATNTAPFALLLILTTLPVALLFLLFQRMLISGLAEEP